MITSTWNVLLYQAIKKDCTTVSQLQARRHNGKSHGKGNWNDKRKKKVRQYPNKPGSVSWPRRTGSSSFIQSASHPAAQAFYPPSSGSWPVGQATLIDDGIHELAASSQHSPAITRRLVVSYTTFSPLPTPMGQAVVFFCLHLPSPTASIFRSGAPCAARTFLSHLSWMPAMKPGHCLTNCKSSKIYWDACNAQPFFVNRDKLLPSCKEWCTRLGNF